MTPSGARAALLVALLSSAVPAFAQPAVAPPPGDTPPPVAPDPAAPQGPRTYTPADFARFAPRNALDMLSQVPGFSIESSDTERRGLGQATGNVLINGERFSGKSTDIFTELRQISAANVTRIEIVDAATLNISGLTGQVANIVTTNRGLSGNYVWRPQIRARRTPARLLNGEVSISGALGGTTYSLSFRNDSFRNGNAGLETVYRPDGTILDLRDEVLSVNGEQPRLSGTLRRNFGDGSILNLKGAFGLNHFNADEISPRSNPTRLRDFHEQEREYNYELGGDYEFGLGGGRLKLIGLRRFEHSPYSQNLIETFADGRPTFGQRFTQVADETETIARAEYRWRGGGADWQVSVEGALNRLDIVNALFELNPLGTFVDIPFPNSAATVQERRAEAMLTYGRPLTSNLTLQASLGGEYSQLSQEGAGGLTRTFYRPKGFLNLAWTPRPGFDISARIERVVGQLNFFDFVASANVSGGTANAGNANLVPPQSWNGQIQATRNLGRWGTVTARLYGRLITDIVDVIPIAGGQSPGNIDGTATVYGLQWTSTFNMDPIGIPGAKLDMNLQFQQTRLTDPLTGVRRPINENMTRQVEINFRHDIPRTQWAYGAGFQQYRQSAGFRLDQRFRFLDTPGSLGVYLEHKNVLGLTVRGSVDNLLGTNESFGRTFFDGNRNATNSNILFTEDRDRFYGPIFTLTISGTI
ncbi:MAG TPA: TonB-dependent receptor plug domain-containing protein [Allosphingosinicella sp.]|nr:TonB-dependent receptor plug domain-containing protein [Allosphingosinicella sp.]